MAPRRRVYMRLLDSHGLEGRRRLGIRGPKGPREDTKEFWDA